LREYQRYIYIYICGSAPAASSVTSKETQKKSIIVEYTCGAVCAVCGPNHAIEPSTVRSKRERERWRSIFLVVHLLLRRVVPHARADAFFFVFSLHVLSLALFYTTLFASIRLFELPRAAGTLTCSLFLLLLWSLSVHTCICDQECKNALHHRRRPVAGPC